MPTFEYVCTDCGNRLEVILHVGDEPPALCEVCGGPLRKVFLPAGILFKGSGFYSTDSRAKPKEKAEEGSKTPASGKGSGKDAGGDTSGSTGKEKSA